MWPAGPSPFFPTAPAHALWPPSTSPPVIPEHEDGLHVRVGVRIVEELLRQPNLHTTHRLMSDARLSRLHSGDCQVEQGRGGGGGAIDRGDGGQDFAGGRLPLSL